MKNISILGSTGSIGQQTLEVVRYHQEEFKVIGLASRFASQTLVSQIKEFSPLIVSVLDKKEKEKLEKEIKDFVNKPEIVNGLSGLIKVATYPLNQTIVVAMVGLSALLPTLKAIESGKDIALATKEILVAAGKLIKEAVSKFKVHLIPIDSEHSAIFQCLNGEEKENLKEIILTCSGGPFRTKTKKELEGVKVEEALCHPNWKMGPKITLDCATLMNKGFEILEAKWLFAVELSKIKVVIHPQSIIHSLVEFKDGNIAGLLSFPDMRLPIQYALSWPKRLKNGFAKKLDLTMIGNLTFEKPDTSRFPCLSLAIQAGKIGGTMPAVLLGADEVAVEEFAKGKIGFTKIPKIIEKTMLAHKLVNNPNLEQIFTAFSWAKRKAKKLILEEK